MEQSHQKIELKGAEEATRIAERDVEQDRRKLLLKMIIEYYFNSVNYCLDRFERHLEDSGDDDDFEDREWILENLVRNVRARCKKLCNILDSHKWKAEEEADFRHFNPWKNVHFLLNH